ncbi:type II secretion system protein N [Ideonella sp. A 288]|uniref:type II secretion system protein N n=1 Tax=Ideonella sp. A 288 TaxID=1962181 RepID=UPI000B4AB699|nr:type II secretion system protein N [Ideonella sp. A 288]
MTRRRTAAVPDRAWARNQRAGRRWAIWGALLGTAIGAVAFAPAAWLADNLHRASGERLLLADARGSVWSGNAVAVLQGGPGSRDASALPGRLHWRLSPTWSGLRLTLRQACCLFAPLRIELRPGWSGMTLRVPARPEGIGQWPARWLEGLGTPWNTLQLGGMMQLSSTGFTVQTVQGRTRFDGALDLSLIGASSRLSSIQPLGSYRLSVRSDSAGADSATLGLSTLDGALRLNGSGQWSGARLRFRGEARAAEGQDAGLANLLNIIGRRQGALSVLSIG